MMKNNKKLAFSLIEILVSLILLSAILAVFVPVVSKKFLARDTSVGAAVSNSNTFEYVIPKSQEDCPSYSVYIDGRVDGKEGFGNVGYGY